MDEVVLLATTGTFDLPDVRKLGYILGLGGTFLSCIYGIYRMLSRRRFVERSAVTRIPDDLGRVCHTFTDYSPWRVRIGLFLVAVGAACGLTAVACGLLGYAGGRVLFALSAALLLFIGVPILLYVSLMRVDRLDLHERGLVLRKGNSKVIVGYHHEISNVLERIVENGSGKGLRGVVIEFRDDEAIEVGPTFLHLGKVADAILRLRAEAGGVGGRLNRPGGDGTESAVDARDRAASDPDGDFARVPVFCPCGEYWYVAESHVGKQVTCSACQRKVAVRARQPG